VAIICRVARLTACLQSFIAQGWRIATQTSAIISALTLRPLLISRGALWMRVYLTLSM
jgi:hypothetical protein